MVYSAALVVSPSKAEVPIHLNNAIVDVAKEAIDSRGVFTVALSGGSLPSFLASLSDSFATRNIDPRFSSWHVVLADERCTPSTHPDSNLGALKTNLLSKVPIPQTQVYGIDESKLQQSTAAVAADYQEVVKKVMSKSGGQLDLCVLGMGPDGHTCSLFPGHALLKEDSLWVAPIEDSPKPPPCRITLTYPVLNTKTRHVIFCGAGSSKSPILQTVFETVSPSKSGYDMAGGSLYQVSMKEPAPYPCGAVLPNSEGVENTLTWVVDKDAFEGVTIS